MRINRLKLERDYSTGGDRFKCMIDIDSEYAGITLKVPDERVQEIVAVISDLIIASGKDTAELLTRQALSQTAIEHKPEK